MLLPDYKNIRVDTIKNLYHKYGVQADVLRLDLLHLVISGNKWFKLKEYLRLAKAEYKTTIVTFGGSFSNHIIATAAACQAEGLKAVGIIRGEEPKELSHTLKDAISYGMQLYFITREEYQQKKIPQSVFELFSTKEVYVINEGGYGMEGKNGAAAILTITDHKKYSHIVTAVGTGTTLAGIASASLPHQEVIGISVLKNNFQLNDDVNFLMKDDSKDHFKIIHDYHFGGYAKYNDQLIDFMNQWFLKTSIPSDFVYTAKMFFAVDDLINKKYFPRDSRLLIIHSGGLQGNLSLPKGKLIF